ncbi:hypothetical protein IWX75_000611 [Arthrobacter sp. CAN_A6]|uniref:hypothetical protein n=1 Tax=Arthrobacter sp. CAN_A6 TaxID=2787721 RepID=UPI0018C9601A
MDITPDRTSRPFDLQSALNVVRDAEAEARRQLGPNEVVLYLVWGLAWLLGYGALHGSRFGWLPIGRGSAFLVFGLCILAGVLVTLIMAARQSHGIRGNSSFIGAMYGSAWALGFLVMGTLSGLVAQGIDDFWLAGLIINSIAVLIVGLLYITGGTTFNDRNQAVLGIWFLVVDMIAIISGPEHFLTVFFVLGSGGFLVGATIEYPRRRMQVR